jgi:anti-sigma factor RsiW
MKCVEIGENLAAYLDGEIEGAPRRAMDDHFAGCAACAAEKRVQAAAWRLLEAAWDPGKAPVAPPGFRERVLARVRAGEGGGGGRILRLRLPAAAAAAAVLLAAGGGAFLLARGPNQGTPLPGDAPSDQILEDLSMLESLDVLQDKDAAVADSLSDYADEDLESLGG